MPQQTRLLLAGGVHIQEHIQEQGAALPVDIVWAYYPVLHMDRSMAELGLVGPETASSSPRLEDQCSALGSVPADEETMVVEERS